MANINIMSRQNPQQKEKYVSKYGFLNDDKESIKKAYQTIGAMQSPEKAGNNLYVGLPSGGYTPRSTTQICQGGTCNLGTSEQSSRGFTTPY
jgi:hypothetical protein